MNLLKETREILKDNGRNIKDIKYVQGNDFGFSVDKFLELADTEYNDGFGSPKVAEDLIVIGEDWWLERHEYDGSEWWEYKELPSPLPINDNVYALTTNQSKEDIPLGYQNLASINGLKVKGE